MKTIPEAVDLMGTAKLAIDNAYERGHPVTVAYVDELGRPSQSIRGSTQVLNARELGIWARSRDTGLAKAIAGNPNVSVLFFGLLPDGAKLLLNLQGRARADSTRNDVVYRNMSDTERGYDPEAKGIAVIVEVDTVSGMSAAGRFSQSSGPT
jgi:hypothetical protein